MPLIIYNNVYGTLAAPILAAAVTLSLTGGQGARFPLTAGQWTYATLVKAATGELEVIKITQRVADVLTIERGKDGTVALDCAALDRVECRPCAAAMNDILADGIDNSRKVVMAGTDAYTGTLSPAITAYSNLAHLVQFTNANTATAPTINLNALGAKTIKNRDGAAFAAGDIKAGSWHVGYYDGTNFVLVTAQTVVAPAGYGQCRLSAPTATSLKLAPQAGNLLTVNGVACTIPSAGVTLAAAPVAANTTYYIYAVATAGVITSLEASATVFVLSSTAGNIGTPIKTGDDTRTLVGMARGNGSTQWTDTETQRFIANYWNRRLRYGKAVFTANRVYSNSGWAEINTEIRNEWLSWLDEAVCVSSSGQYQADTAGSTYAQALGIDGTGVEDGATGNNDSAAGQALSLHPYGISVNRTMAEGYHYATLLAIHGGGASGTYSGGGAGALRCAVHTLVQN